MTAFVLGYLPGVAPADRVSWNAADDRVARHVAGNDRTGADDGAAADVDPVEDRGVCTDPHVVFDHDPLGA